MGFLKPIAFIGRALVDMVIVTAIIMFVPGLPPYVTFESFFITPAMPLEGKLAPNSKLDRALPILQDEILGPESVAVRKDELYTGLIGGDVIRYKNGKMDVVAKFGKDCEGQWEEAKCGRPLGMRFDPSSPSHLIVADAYYGIFRVNVDSGSVETLVSSNDTIEGKRPMNPNDLDIAKDGTIYWSDSSTNVYLQDATIEFLGEPSGRLLKYDPKTKTTEVLLEKLHFPNGVQLVKNENYVLVSETARSRVIRYNLKAGKDEDKSDIFIDALPGSPDNIRPNGRGGVYVSLIAPRYEKAGLLDLLAPHPYVRKFLLRLMCIVKAMLSGIQAVGSIEFVDKAQYWIGHLEIVATVLPKHSIIVELDENGRIIGSLQSLDGPVHHISEITIDNEGKFAYLGSPYNKQIWKVIVEDIRQRPPQKIPEMTLG